MHAYVNGIYTCMCIRRHFNNWGEPERGPHDAVYVDFVCLMCVLASIFGFLDLIRISIVNSATFLGFIYLQGHRLAPHHALHVNNYIMHVYQSFLVHLRRLTI